MDVTILGDTDGDMEVWTLLRLNAGRGWAIDGAILKVGIAEFVCVLAIEAGICCLVMLMGDCGIIGDMTDIFWGVMEFPKAVVPDETSPLGEAIDKEVVGRITILEEPPYICDCGCCWTVSTIATFTGWTWKPCWTKLTGCATCWTTGCTISTGVKDETCTTGCVVCIIFCDTSITGGTTLTTGT